MDPEALRAISVGLPQSESAQGAERHQGAERLQNAERHKSARSPYWQYAWEVVEMPREHRVTRGSNIYKPVKAIEAEVKWLVATEEKARRPVGAQGAKDDKVLKSNLKQNRLLGGSQGQLRHAKVRILWENSAVKQT